MLFKINFNTLQLLPIQEISTAAPLKATTSYKNNSYNLRSLIISKKVSVIYTNEKIKGYLEILNKKQGGLIEKFVWHLN